MKKVARLLLALALVSCLLLALPFSASAANSEKLNDLKVSISTDDSKYSAGEDIEVSVEVQNGKTHGIEGVDVSIWLPNALEVQSGESATEDMTIAAGETKSVSVVVKMADGASKFNFLTVLIIAGCALAVIGIVVIIVVVVRKHKKAAKVLSVLLCLVMALSLLPLGAFAADNDVTITVDKTVTVGGRKYTLKANVTVPSIWVNSQCMVSFDTDGGSAVDSQVIAMGGKATTPISPQKEGFAFVGWYADKELTTEFDFTAPVPASCTVYARWVDVADKTDTDRDGLTDPVEVYLKTDPSKADTDGDGLIDYVEVVKLSYDPLKKDTDGNNVTDDLEDYDKDGISNKAELAKGTDPVLKDTDGDGLDDNIEPNYTTDPLKPDTDGDGVSDGKEVQLGTDPLVAQATFDMHLTADNTNDKVKPSVDIQLFGSQVETLRIEAVQNATFFPETMPGYMGKAYDFFVEGGFAEATIHFEFDASGLAPDAEPVICYFNEQTQELEELATTIVGNVASATVTHFSKYILIDRKVYQNSFTWTDVWDNTTTYTGVEIVLVIDDSGSMTSNDRNNQRLEVAKTLVEQLSKSSKVGVVKFASTTSLLTSTLTTDKEAAKSYLTTSHFRSSGNTYMYTAINSALNMYESTDTATLRMMVVLSDGAANDTGKHNATITAANNKGVKIFTVGLGASSSSYFTNYLQPLAVNTGGEFHLSSDAEGLAEIYKNIKEKIDIETDSDNDGIPDYYEDNMLSFNGVHIQLDKNNADTDGDGLKDGEEVQLKFEYNADRTQVKVTGKIVLGDPTKSDTDGDGLYDSKDAEPFKWNISDRDLVMLAQICYEDIPAGTMLDTLATTHPSMAKNIADSFKGAATLEELRGWSVVETHYASGGLQIAVFEKDGQLVFACRGSEDKSIWYKSAEFWKDWVIADGLGWLTGINAQAPGAKVFAERIMKQYPSYDVYVTGHSLGGNVAYNLGSKALDVDSSRVKKINTHNGLGLLFGITLGVTDWVDEYRLQKHSNKITDYKIEGDPVFPLSPFHYGTRVEKSLCDGAYGPHDLYSFLVHLPRYEKTPSTGGR